ncbi:helix-turn-helix domain-containing protein [Virgisporangium aurantiacum]|uniref:Transcriptional regulator n=1 Tax=Virgisporangium aurantiacum TaxID=175570 RepID=A0A8J4E0R4_9ACTN|nr:helix-turn-helix transcriptional regulator [Virgisporangium aurantiacum]GIJ58015.1 transcriptional regulator [Virgisporangium aurantiacum]
MVLGGQLRRLRERRGITREKAGYEIRSSESKISRMELGRVGFKERDVADLLTLYGVDDAEERTALVTLARQANQPNWWNRYGDVLPNWLQSYLGLETAATIIRSYEVQFVAGLLQTPGYARAVITLGHGAASTEEIDRRVALRIERQKILDRENAPRMWAVIDEAALRRPIGGADVMRDQIDALITASKRPNVQIQLLPFEVGGHAAAGGAYTILRFPDRELPDVVYIEQLTGALYLDKREDVDHYAITMERLCMEAAPPEETVRRLAELKRSAYPEG